MRHAAFKACENSAQAAITTLMQLDYSNLEASSKSVGSPSSDCYGLTDGPDRWKHLSSPPGYTDVPTTVCIIAQLTSMILIAQAASG